MEAGRGSGIVEEKRSKRRVEKVEREGVLNI
jgi:hypothetical protein